MRRSLLNLLNRNRGRGFFRAETSAQGENVIYVYDVIVSSEQDAEWWGGISAESVVKALAVMDGDVKVRINSPGGDVFGGQAMVNAIRAYDRGKVTAYIDGYAASAASSVAIAADTVIMGEGSMFMIHKAWTIELGNADDFRNTAALLDKIDGNLINAYAEKTGKSAEDVKALMDSGDTWFNVQEALDFGLADEKAAPSNTASIDWDLSAYGREETGNDAKPLDAAAVKAMIAEALNSASASPQDEDAETEDERDQRLRQHQLKLLSA